MKTFTLSEKEEQSAKEWYEVHRKKCIKAKFDSLNKRKEISVSYEFFPTGLGEVSIIKCQHCKKEKNITDYDSW